MLFEVTRTSQDGLYDHKIPPCGDVVWHSNRWVVHIDTLEDLLAFVEKYGGRVVIRQLERVRWIDSIQYRWVGDEFEIEIYDDRRE